MGPCRRGSVSSAGLGWGGARRRRAVPAINLLLEQSRSHLDQVQSGDLAAEMSAGALVVDIRPLEQRRRDGVRLGAVVIDRNVLEWRLDPSSPHRLPVVRAGLRVVLVCDQGFSSSLAAATLRGVGLRRATDLVGGYQAWLALGHGPRS